MKYKKAIKELRNGSIQIENDLLPSTKEIKKLLKKAFHEEQINGPIKYYKYYYKFPSGGYNAVNLTTSLINVKISEISTKKNKLNQLEKSFSELAKNVAELKQKDWGSIIPSEHTKNLDVDFENVINKLEVGKWYKTNSHQVYWLMNYQKEGYSNNNYGFNTKSKWLDGCCMYSDGFNFEPATSEEVEKALIEEAKRRGYKESCKIKSLIYNAQVVGFSEVGRIKYIEDVNELVYFGSVVFKDGNWAEIIQEETPIKEEDVIDWDIRQFVISKDGALILSNGNHEGEKFQGYEYCDEKFQELHITYNKDAFFKFKGTLTIKQE